MKSHYFTYAKRGLFGLAAWGALSLASAACGGTEEDGIPFHGEAPALPGFSYDTGLMPASGPAKVSLKLAAQGNLVVDAQGAVRDGKLVGNAGTGRAKLDVHVKLEGRLKVDSALKKYDGEIPGLANVDVPIVAETPFDPFLLDGKTADISADVPETQLPDIPLGSVPGKLRLTIVAGSKVTAKYAGGCMAISGGQATYAGSAVLSGTLVVKGAIELDLPAPLDKTIELTEVSVPIPEGTRDIPFGAVAVSASDATEGPSCAPPAGSRDGGVVGEDGAIITPDGSVCGPANCNGCCRDGVCLGGRTRTACGGGGGACESCSGGTSCVEGACRDTACGPANCGGCCQGGVCVAGTSASACGFNGAACAACPGGTTCDGLSCVSATCKSTCTSGCCSGTTCNPGTAITACGKNGDSCVACASGLSCVSGTCTVAPTARYDLLLFSATIPGTKTSGDAWDAFNGLPDPYAKLASVQGASKHEGSTPTLDDTRTPNWNAVVLSNVAASELKSSVRIDLFDDDVSFDDTIGGCAIAITDAAFDGSLRTGTCAASTTGVAFTFTYRLLKR